MSIQFDEYKFWIVLKIKWITNKHNYWNKMLLDGNENEFTQSKQTFPNKILFSFIRTQYFLIRNQLLKENSLDAKRKLIL